MIVAVRVDVFCGVGVKVPVDGSLVVDEGVEVPVEEGLFVGISLGVPVLDGEKVEENVKVGDAVEVF